jgi:hypothetical protein
LGEISGLFLYLEISFLRIPHLYNNSTTQSFPAAGTFALTRQLLQPVKGFFSA